VTDSANAAKPPEPSASAKPLRLSKVPKRADLRRYPGLGLYSALFFAFLYIPILVVIGYAFNKNKLVTIWGGFSTSWFGNIAKNQQLRTAAKNSLTVAVVATIVSTVVATLAAIALVTWPRRAKSVATGLLAAPLFVPEIISAVATLSFFVLLKVELGLRTVMLAHITFCIPFAFLPVRARLQSVDQRLFEAAVDLGARRGAVLRRITLPLLGPGILSGAVLAFVISLDDFLITFFVAGPGSSTLPVFIFGMIKNGITPAINAASTLLVLVSTVLVVVAWLLSRSDTSAKAPR
jgi:spermidine/putrescine transport system permease protein